ncbi:MAG: hypothetical protein ACI8TQ_001926 [Planctomycetota bacterium]|jgi:hypothetical protein
MSFEREIVLLGPQRLKPILAQTLAARKITGPIALVTAGWEERESEDRELAEHVGMDVRNLAVYARVEDVFRRDPELYQGMLNRHDTLRKIQSFYRLRLAGALDSARTLLAREDVDLELLGPQRTAAIETVRSLDAEHLGRVLDVHAEFEDKWKPEQREAVARHRSELAAEMDGSQALCIAGGHVAILLNRMRLLDVCGLSGDLPIIAWSAGAMVLGDRIVLFHDSPPQGPGDAEVLEAGFGLCQQVVPLPHASRRLRLKDNTRVALFARRFGPATCVVLDDLSVVTFSAGELQGKPGVKLLSETGIVEEASAA